MIIEQNDNYDINSFLKLEESNTKQAYDTLNRPQTAPNRSNFKIKAKS